MRDRPDHVLFHRAHRDTQPICHILLSYAFDATEHENLTCAVRQLVEGGQYGVDRLDAGHLVIGPMVVEEMPLGVFLVSVLRVGFLLA